MAVVKEYVNGSCKIFIHDDSIREPEEVKKIIDRVSMIVINEEIRRSTENKKSL